MFIFINTFLEALSTFAREVPEYYPKLEEFVEQSKALPDKIQSEASGLGNPMKVPGIVKNGIFPIFFVFDPVPRG